MLGAPPDTTSQLHPGRPEKAMTIAAVFVCSDGVLLASDALYSDEPRRYGPKFWAMRAGDTPVVLGGAGTERGLKRIREEVEAKLRPGQSCLDIARIIEEA